MTFKPRFCPHPDCSAHTRAPFLFRRRGVFRRRCDRRVVPRFLCLTCNRNFSEQSFRLDYRLKRPDLLPRFFFDRISKVTHRQSARNHGCSRTTEERHFRRLSAHCAAFHEQRLEEVIARGGLGQIFLLDELETYEQHRIKQPVTVPVLIERETGFVIDTRVGTLPSRETPPTVIAGEERRKSESRQVVKASFERLRKVCDKKRTISVLTDQKATYATLLRQLFGARCTHLKTSSKRKRDVTNPLWPINHTLARLRDGISRLVRETWAAAKKRRWLAGHLAIWVCYRNYIRGRTNRLHQNTPAMALGVQESRWSVRQLLEWRVLPCATVQR